MNSHWKRYRDADYNNKRRLRIAYPEHREMYNIIDQHLENHRLSGHL